MVDCEGVSMDAQVEKERGDEEKEGGQSKSILSPQLKAMIRIKKKYLKRSNSVRLSTSSAVSDGSLHPKSPQPRKPKRRKSRVLFPNDTLIFKPKKERSGTKPFLLLFSVIVFIQVILPDLFLECHFVPELIVFKEVSPIYHWFVLFLHVLVWISKFTKRQRWKVQGSGSKSPAICLFHPWTQPANFTN